MSNMGQEGVGVNDGYWLVLLDSSFVKQIPVERIISALQKITLNFLEPSMQAQGSRGTWRPRHKSP